MMNIQSQWDLTAKIMMNPNNTESVFATPKCKQIDLPLQLALPWAATDCICIAFHNFCATLHDHSSAQHVLIRAYVIVIRTLADTRGFYRHCAPKYAYSISKQKKLKNMCSSVAK